MAEAKVKGGLAAKLARVMGEVGGIPKDRKNEQQGYMYRSEDAVVERLRALLAAEGVAVVPIVLTAEFLPPQTNPNNKVINLCLVTLQLDYVDGETGEKLSAKAVGTAMDSGDKAIFKATTGAYKYALQKTFMISEGDDQETPEKNGKSEPAMIPMPQAKTDDIPEESDSRPPDPYFPPEEKFPVVMITGVTRKTAAGKTTFTIHFSDETKALTFSETVARQAKAYFEKLAPVFKTTKANGFIEDVVPANPEAYLKEKK
jgi:hypothetical protein